MKKIIGIISFFFLFVLSSCETPDQGEINIVLNDLPGLGNLYQPYEIEMLEGEEKNIEISTTDEKECQFKLGSREGDQFKSLELFEVNSFIITKVNQGINLKAVAEGVTYVKISVEKEAVFLRVKINKAEEETPKTIKIISIGNSFSGDALAYLYEIFIDFGYSEVIIANLNLAGASLETHMTRINLNTPVPIYKKKTDGKWNTLSGYTVKAGIKDEDWDVITLQQSSGYSGISDSYDPYLEQLIEFINENKTNEAAKIFWHMTWAYQQDSNHQHFVFYNNDQLTMYNAIIAATKAKIVSNSKIAGIIPVGTAIQNLRTIIGDTITSDGYHLSIDVGRFTAGLTWFATISNQDFANLNYYPSGMSFSKVDEIKRAVKAALEKPFEVSNLK